MGGVESGGMSWLPRVGTSRTSRLVAIVVIAFVVAVAYIPGATALAILLAGEA